ncbi:MAG: hypothetical protein ABWZ16_06465 [Microbacterium sp.]
MRADQGRSFTDSSRLWRALLAGLGGLWAALTLPLVATAFGSAQWVWVFDYPVYVEARQWAGNPYAVFGALVSLSFLTIGIALAPDLRRARWGGLAMAVLIMIGAPVTALSYLNSSERAPLHFTWGWEFYVLVAVGLSGIAAAATAGRRWRVGVRVLLGMTLLILIAGTLLLGYWPHGSLVFLAVEAIVIIATAPRDAPLAAERDTHAMHVQNSR